MPILDDDDEPHRGRKRPIHHLAFEGRRQTIAAWALEKNIPVAVLYARVRAGWSTEKALTVHESIAAELAALSK